MLKRDALAFPSFWTLQIAGSVGFWFLGVLSELPYHTWAEFRYQSIFCVTVGITSCLLRPVCRSLYNRSLPWFGIEVRAFGWSAGLAVIATFVSEFIKLRSLQPVLSGFLENWVSFAVVFFLWCTLYFSIKQWQQAAREKEQLALGRERLVRAESSAREARLSSLRYQLNPHFLFNSLNAVSTLVLKGESAAATRMLAQIGELLRATLDNNVLPETSLSQEIVFIQQYLAIEQTRLGSRLQVEMKIAPESLDAVVPTMLLQPLVENAVRHGVAPAAEGGTIAIESAMRSDRLWLTIRNSAPPQNGKTSRGIGLTNTAERLSVLYGDNHRLESHTSESGDYEVTIEIPLRRVTSNVQGVLCAH